MWPINYGFGSNLCNREERVSISLQARNVGMPKPSHAKPYMVWLMDTGEEIHDKWPQKEKNGHILKWRQQGCDSELVAVVLCPIMLGEHWCMHIRRL